MKRGNNVESVLMVLGLGLGIGMTGCLQQDEISSETQNLEAINSFSDDVLTASSSLLIGMASDRLLVGDQINLDLQTLSTDEEELLVYTIRCALDTTDTVYLTVGAQTYTFQGELNLTPGWASTSLDADQQALLSGCLLAHVNEYQVPVRISLQADGLTTSLDEETRFLGWEGAFYGNLFDASQPMYACSGDTAPDFTVSYPNHDTTAGDRLLRRCTDVESGTKTLCGFEYVGACSAVCDTPTLDGYAGCWSDAAKTQTRYDNPMNVWYLAYDDPESSWDTYYDQIYGP